MTETTIVERLKFTLESAYPYDIEIATLYNAVLRRDDAHMSLRRRQQTLGKYISQANKEYQNEGKPDRIRPGVRRASYCIKR